MTHPSAGRPLWVTLTLLTLSAGLIVVFVLLGNWQMRRLEWKVALIEAVETRAFGEAVELPPRFDPAQHSYLRARANGTMDATKATLVKAVTDLGPGYWVMIPMDLGYETLWINSGFVPTEQKDPSSWNLPEGPITGLLRETVPGGTLLEKNRPDINRWVSRDVRALSNANGIGATLPYFMDAQHQTSPTDWPRGGLTIVQLRNTHLSYALTWYAMAILFAATLLWLLRSARKESKVSDRN